MGYRNTYTHAAPTTPPWALNLMPHLVELLPCDIHVLIGLPPLHLWVFPAAAAVAADGLFHILASSLENQLLISYSVGQHFCN